MDGIEDIVIVGAGIAGLATALGLHRLGVKSLVLESSDSLRVTGYGFVTYANAWRALDALGVGELLRQRHLPIEKISFVSLTTGIVTSQLPIRTQSQSSELRCLRRRLLLEILLQELPEGTVRFRSKVVSIEECENHTKVHLADGSFLKTKVLLGCDGVNSVVSKWLGLSKPCYARRYAIRALSEFPQGHGFVSDFIQYNGLGFRSGFISSDEKLIYWFFAYASSHECEEKEVSPMELKQFVMSKLDMVPQRIKAVVYNTGLDCFIISPLTYRKPWELLWGNICKGGVAVAGDALHPMTPDIGQGACSSLEDSVALSRCIGEAFSERNVGKEEESERVRKALEKYANQRKWRSFDLIVSGLIVGWIGQMDGWLMSFLRDKLLFKYVVRKIMKRATDFDPGTLYSS